MQCTARGNYYSIAHVPPHSLFRVQRENLTQKKSLFSVMNATKRALEAHNQGREADGNKREGHGVVGDIKKNMEERKSRRELL